MRWFGKARGDLDSMPDEEFWDLAAAAVYLEERQAENVREGIKKALSDIADRAGG